MTKSRKLTALLMTTVFSFHQITYAQKVETTADGSIVTYEKDYFEAYSAVTLLDMLQIIPGVKEILEANRNQFRGGGGGGGQGERGFGSSGDQILIDGKRLAGKTNNIDDNLGRISANQVEKIELIRGAASGLDVQSQGLVINITLIGGASTSSTFWKASGKYTFDHDFQPEFLVSHSGSTGNLDYSLSAEWENGGFNFDRDEQIFNDTGDKTADQTIDGGFEWKSIQVNSNIDYTFQSGAVLRLNGLFSPGKREGLELRDKTSDTLRPVIWDTDGDSDEWEVGGDFTQSLGSIGRLKALFVLNGEDEEETVNRFKGSGGDKFEYNTESSSKHASEKILRASITSSLTSSQSLEWGGEIAINTSNGTFSNLERDSADDVFALTNIDKVDIKENRYEIFAHHTYNITAALVLQSSLTTEFSKIVADNITSGITQPQRNTSFTYLKPRLNLRYDVTDRDQIRATVEKKVSQLEFRNFVTSFNRQTEVLELGNTAIRPEQIWEYSAAYEHRFANDGGSIEAEIFYHNFKDHITKVDFTQYQNHAGDMIDANAFFALGKDEDLIELIDNTGDGFASKSGNVDSATAYGIKLKSSLRLGVIGLPQAVVGLGYTYEKKETTDQFTMLERPFDRHSDHIFNFNFRHDITDLGLTYGFNGSVRSDRAAHDINYYWPMNPGTEFTAFAEYNIFNGIKMRVDLENVLKTRGRSTFIGYRDHIRFDDSWGRIEKHTKNPTEITVSIQGTF